MHKILIQNLGPVEQCEMEIKDCTIFTGPQASGKSTVAKAVFFFRNIKNLLYQQIAKHHFTQDPDYKKNMSVSVKSRLVHEIRLNFLQIFGTTWCMEPDMCMKYDYNEETSITISLKQNKTSPNYVWVDLSDDLEKFLQVLDMEMRGTDGDFMHGFMDEMRRKIEVVFHDAYETIYIPAGRSLITLLSVQLNYIYGAMDDIQKRSLDYCTQSYLERVLRLKSSFTEGVRQMVNAAFDWAAGKVDRELFGEAVGLIHQILGGEYRYVDGEERLQMGENRYVKINFASSGQQEAVWILNTLFYQLLYGRKTFFIVEEPESNLFPDAQKKITDFIALAGKQGENQIFVTTHSPYILGEINNLLYANHISSQVDHKKLAELIPRRWWLPYGNTAAFYIQGGRMENCMDEELQAICNEVIDGASEEINRTFERMLDLKENTKGEGI